MTMQSLWEPKLRIERLFRNALQEIAKQIIMRIGDAGDIDTIRQTLQKMSKAPELLTYAEAAAMQMVTHLCADSGKTWRQAAFANSRGREVYQAIQRELQGKTGRLLLEQVQRNAGIIRTLPNNIADDITQYIARETLKGRRASDIAEEIKKKFPEQTKANADLIGRTEVSKTQSALVESRARQFGIEWYVWRAVGGISGDGRTRKSHRGMAGVLVNWNDPPAPEALFPIIGKSGKRYRSTLGRYHAGCCPNCRCYAEPVISLDMFSWPMRIYRGGSISRISKREFIKLSGIAA